ncbi:MAG: sugar transferase [Ignavibacteria bacterium]|jgi:lipopolysaccharide/colanic/teichoic acid biosynthesis glycosyltransferase|nr:sugar transferase [Ignavibacteria bacterium]MDH7527467.1 sugar transferase [Ignavibacteria bacterium]
MYKNYIKRFLDRAVSFILILLLFPLLILISFLIYFETHKFPIIIQERAIALNKKRIRIFKFRTFKENQIPLFYSSQNILSHPELFKYVTITGMFLRLTGLDELPQLLNVIKGEMSLIGPRPLIIEDLRHIKIYYPDLYKEREKIEVKPGITGLWQISKDDDFSVEYLIKKDTEYQSNLSFINDVKILLNTLKVAVLMKHKDSLKVSKESYYLIWLFNFVVNLYILLLMVIFLNKI